jgi:diaminopimelate epimerase
MLQFSKMHGLGNDFMVIDGINQTFIPIASQISRWADRHFGVGFDQLLLVENSEREDALFKYRIFNADGSEVAQCGNGARCFARFIREQGLTSERSIPVETSAGILHLTMIDDERVRVNMGVPEFRPWRIPFKAAARAARYPLEVNDETLQISALAIGNPHAVLLVDDIEDADVEDLGPAIESHPDFPERVNVGFMQIIDPTHFKLRVYERGTGETLACGSGACAAMAAGQVAGLLETEGVTASLRGGDLLLDWQGEDYPVMMTGGTATVYQGELHL